MSDTAAETKETPVVASPEKKEVVCERKPAAKEEAKQENGKETKPEQNGSSENGEESSEEKKPVENGDNTDVCSLPQKRKSEVAATEDSTDSAAAKDGASPEKKAKLEEKAENGEAEATA